MRKISLPLVLSAAVAAGVFSACNPKFDWRDYRSTNAPYTALFPGKPSAHTRAIELDGMQVSMTMTASDVDGATFAVGSAQLTDPAKAPAALLAMKNALIKNIGATINSEKSSMTASATVTSSSSKASIEIEASGMKNGKPMLLVGRFLAQDKWIYQVIVLGKEKQVSRDNIDMFLSSFKLN